MVRRFPRVLGLALLLGALLAGCTEAPPGGGGGDSGAEDGEDGGDSGDLGPFFGFAPGIDQVALPAGTAGVVDGHVFDSETGFPIPEALVLATCVRERLPGLDGDGKLDARMVPVATDGGFSMLDLDAFADCQRIEYTIQAAGYTLSVPLSSGPVTPGVQYLVYGALTPTS